MSDEIKMKFKIGDTVGMEFHLGGSVQPSSQSSIITDVTINIPGVIFGTFGEMEAVQDGN